MSAEKILIVDDEPLMREMIREYLEFEKFTADEAKDGAEGLEKAESGEYRLIILDVMMPRMDGWTVVRELRKTSEIPVIMLTARGEEYDKLLGFELGVDDYIVKPFSPKELAARMKAVLKRTEKKKPSEKEVIQFEGLVINPSHRTVEVDGSTVNVTPKEYELLKFLMENPNIAFSRDQLLDGVWGIDFFGDDRTVDTHIKMLRESVKPYRKWIATVWGVGYKFEPEGKE